MRSLIMAVVGFFFLLSACTPNLVNLRKIETKIPDRFKEMEKSEEFKKFAEDNKTIRLLDSIEKKVDYSQEAGFVIDTTVHNIEKIVKGRKYSFFNYLDKDSEITYLSARTIKPDGTIINLSMDDIYVRAINHYSFDYVDKTKKVKFNIKNVEDGSIVEFMMKSRQYLKCESDVSYFFSLESTSRPIMAIDYKLDVPQWMTENILDKMKLRTKILNCEKVKLEKSSYSEDDKKRVVFNWTIENIPKSEIDFHVVCRMCLKKYLMINVSKWNNWTEMSKELYSLYVGQINPSEKVAVKTKELTEGISDAKGKIKALSNYIQSFEINYFMDNYSSKHKATVPEIVLRRRYGTNKDVAMLLVTMLRSAGFKKSFPVLIRDLQALPFEKDLLINSYSDILVYIETLGGQKYWVDPSSYQSDLNIISENSENRTGLILSEDGSYANAVTPKPSSEKNRKDYSVKYLIDGSLRLKTSVIAKYSGQRAFSKRYSVINSNRKEKLVRAANMLKDGYFNGMISSEGKVFEVEYSGCNDIDKDVELSFSADVKAFRKSKYNDTLRLDLIPLNPYSLYDFPPFSHEERKNPVMWRKRRNSSVTVDIIYPSDKLELVLFPKSSDVIFDKKDFFIKTTIIKNVPGQFSYKIDLKRDIKKVETSEFVKVQKIYSKLIKVFKNHIIFRERVTQ